MANSVIELLFRNLRTEINKVVRENEGLRSKNHELELKVLEKQKCQTERRPNDTTTS
jgi:hypothetical protein